MSLVSTERQRANVWRVLIRVAEGFRAPWMRYLHRRRQLHDLAELAAMDDLSLRDIGISRLEIRAAIRSGEDLHAMQR